MSKGPILVVAYDRLGERMAGPAIRSLALASELAGLDTVTVLFEGDTPPKGPASYPENLLFTPMESHERTPVAFSGYRMALCPPLIALTLPEILEGDVPIVVDLFDPVIWENLELYKSLPSGERQFQHERHLAALMAALMRGDFFLAAGNRQMDLFTGTIMALNRINPSTWQREKGPEQYVGEVPFGIPDVDPPENLELSDNPDYSGLSDKKIIIWGGGMWDWLDPVTVVKAFRKIVDEIRDAHLVFPGIDHPNPHIPEMSNVRLVRNEVDALGLAEKVTMGKWLDRMSYLGLLAKSSVAVSTHRAGYESRYAVRTRFMDAIWLGVPIVASSGDEYSAMIDDCGIGKSVKPGDADGFASAVIETINYGRESYKDKFEPVRDALRWSHVARPLIDWASNPRITHGIGSEFFTGALGDPSPRGKPTNLGSILRRLSKMMRKD